MLIFVDFKSAGRSTQNRLIQDPDEQAADTRFLGFKVYYTDTAKYDVLELGF
jgi:hypothetical protein